MDMLIVVSTGPTSEAVLSFFVDYMFSGPLPWTVQQGREWIKVRTLSGEITQKWRFCTRQFLQSWLMSVAELQRLFHNKWNDLRFSRRWLRRMASSGMLRRVALVRTDVSKERSPSFIRVTRIGELGTTLAVTSNRRTRNVRWLLVVV
jgi:hypothetical protein